MSSNQPVLDLGGMPGPGSRPDWTQAGWWDAELRPEVRELLSLPLGPDLQDALLKIAAVDAADGCDPGFCVPHTVSTLDDRIGIPATPACLVVLVAAWNSVVSWVTHRADQQLIATVAARPVQFQLSSDQGDFGALTDPAVDEVAPRFGCRRVVPIIASAAPVGYSRSRNSVTLWHRGWSLPSTPTS